MTPFFQDASVTLYHGDAMDVLRVQRETGALMPATVDATITDPPYNETHLEWDVWPDGWPDLAGDVSRNLWCFGSLRMFMERRDSFRDGGWTYGQDIVWEKHNGSNMAADRFKRVHELAVQFYQGPWETLYREVQTTPDQVARQVRRKKRPPQWGDVGESVYVAENGGDRMQRSVIFARSCHGYAVNETQKPEDIVAPLIKYSVPPGGIVLDCFAGSGTTLAVARKLGRRAIGIEKRLEQCERIVERLSQGELALGVP